MPAVEVELIEHAHAVQSAISRSMFQREEYYRRRGPLLVSQLSDSSAIRTWLPMFYKQHIARWEKKGETSPFVVGADGVARYVTVLSECAKAAKLRLKGA